MTHTTHIHSFRIFVIATLLAIPVGFGMGDVVLRASDQPMVASVLRAVRVRKPVVKKLVTPVVRGIPIRVIDQSVLRRRSSTGSSVSSSASSVARTYQKSGCGDGIVLDEACDDGNTKAGDGCSASCTVETGFYCNQGQPSRCWTACGDSVVASTERCDDGNTVNGDGCSTVCKDEFGWKCTGSPSLCAVPAICGDHVIGSGEQCDDGNNKNNDGCNDSCQTE